METRAGSTFRGRRLAFGLGLVGLGALLAAACSDAERAYLACEDSRHCTDGGEAGASATRDDGTEGSLGGSGPGGDLGMSQGGSPGGSGGNPGGADADGESGAGGEREAPTCVGVTCESAPESACVSASEFKAYDAVGNCEDGECSYGYRLIECGCENDACKTDPCTDIVCSDPPVPSCPAARVQREYAAVGECSEGSCDYAPTDTPCTTNLACQNGICSLCEADDSCGSTCAPCAAAKPRCRRSGNSSSCVECLDNDDCHDGKVCNAGTHTCVQRSCDGLAMCVGNMSCCAVVDVPAGEFNRGNDVQAQASVSAFRLDKFEVTVGRFRKYVDAYSQTGIPAGAGKNPNDDEATGWDKSWDSLLPKTTTDLKAQLAYCGDTGTWTSSAGTSETKPITCVSWFDAMAFCIWDGGRLPTEAEWNYAAAGGDEQRTYPWGGSISSTEAVYGGVASPLAVGSKTKGNGLWGNSDLAGNVAEWVEDYFSVDYVLPCDDCAVHVSDPNHVVRGGSYQHPPESVTTTYRAFVSGGLQPYVGFRCVRMP